MKLAEAETTDRTEKEKTMRKYPKLEKERKIDEKSFLKCLLCTHMLGLTGPLTGRCEIEIDEKWVSHLLTCIMYYTLLIIALLSHFIYLY